MRNLLLLPFLVALLTACAGQGTVPAKQANGFDPSQFAKTDVDRVAETHQREIFHDLRLLTEKLYRRNPRELKKGGQATVSAGVARIFLNRREWKFAELGNAQGAQAIHLAFLEDTKATGCLL